MNTKTICTVLAIAAIALAWFFRYDVAPAGGGALAVRLDRWTGELMLTGADGHFHEVKPVAQPGQ
ncbi:hypothetical protein FSY45_24690 [Comamonas sp. Z1]|uniref:hypothetical protein n=1 Tax=Comamonas TaxID=283 RepID=UPI0011E80C53|nr:MULTISPECIES: hypothetical protein [Comamonas]TYK70266.1 hypothetical protein FSY45_24690 [Comamonas sp. Z1]UBQ44631.1 hypothetical protein LCH15_26120 [Comamonas thiooxydans]